MNRPTQPIFKRPAPPNDKASPFSDDSFERKELAERLTQFLSRLPDGGVLAIDAPWGEGKTYFGTNWHAQLVAAGIRSTYVDCFDRDFIEDPFLMIAGELLDLVKSNQPAAKRKLLDASKKIGAALLPAATRAVVNAAGHWVLGKADLVGELGDLAESLEEKSAAGLESLVEHQLKAYAAEKESLAAFRDALQTFASELESPVVIFLDELDRCRPDFAVRTIERIKHFFEVPNVVFVLLLNRAQLSAAVRGIYGASVDAEAYVGKFVQLSLALPKRVSVARGDLDDNRKHCEKTLERYGFQLAEGVKGFASAMGVLATLLGFSLRDVERCVTLYSFAQPPIFGGALIAWPIALKIAKPELFRRLLLNEKSADIEAEKIAMSLNEMAPDLRHLFSSWSQVHEFASIGFAGEGFDDIEREILRITSGRCDVEGFRNILFGRVDLSVAR